MNRLPRILLTAATALSLLLCLTLAVLCVASVWYEYKAVLGIRPYAVLADSRSGEIALTLITDPAIPSRYAAYATASKVEPTHWKLSQILGGRWGFAARHDVQPRPSLPPTDYRLVVVPHWLPSLLFALLPAARWMRRRRPSSDNPDDFDRSTRANSTAPS